MERFWKFALGQRLSEFPEHNLKGKHMNLNPFDSNQNDLNTPTTNENCYRDIKVIDISPTWMTYKQLMESTANLEDTRE